MLYEVITSQEHCYCAPPSLSPQEKYSDRKWYLLSGNQLFRLKSGKTSHKFQFDAHKNLPALFHQMPSPLLQPRIDEYVITSYSIHYTKLYERTKSDFPELPVEPNIFELDPSDMPIMNINRITSYNVCYTKLLRFFIKSALLMRSYFMLSIFFEIKDKSSINVPFKERKKIMYF